MSSGRQLSVAGLVSILATASATAQTMGGRFMSTGPASIRLGFTFDEILGLVLIVAVALFVISLAKHR